MDVTAKRYRPDIDRPRIRAPAPAASIRPCLRRAMAAVFLFAAAILSCDSAPQEARFRIRRVHVAVLRGEGFPELRDPSVRRMRISPDRSAIALLLWDKASETYDRPATIGRDGSGGRILVAEPVGEFAWRSDREIASTRRGEGGGPWRAVGLDGSKIALLVRGEDGHAIFYPAWDLCDARGERIELVDLYSHDLSEELVWLSPDALAYAKDGRPGMAEIRGSASAPRRPSEKSGREHP